MIEFILCSTLVTRGCCIRCFLAIASMTVLIVVVVSASVTADETQSDPGHPPGKFSVGAGYERYSAEWIGHAGTVMKDTRQNRIFLKADYWTAPRLRVSARLGAADLFVPEGDLYFLRSHVDYGFSPFGSISLNWTPVGAQPGTEGGAIEVLFEVSAFATYAADKIEGSYDSGWGEPLEYEAWPEVSSMWEGKVGLLLSTQSGASRFGAGLMFLDSGAETRTHIKTGWGEGTETDYSKTQNNIGMMGAWRFSPGADMILDTRIVWTGPALLFEVSIGRVLAR